MSALGDRPAAEVTTAHIEALLLSHAREGVGARSVNKHRQVLSAVFNFGLSPDKARRWDLSGNPAAAAAKRREDGPAGSRSSPSSRSRHWRELRRPALGVALMSTRRPMAHSYAPGTTHSSPSFCASPPRRAFAWASSWQCAGVTSAGRASARRRAGSLRRRRRERPRGRRVRYVPLGDQALGALDRLSRRANFTSAGDYVFASVAGDRLDPSALRRRYVAARNAAGLPPLRFHDLRHTAGTLLTRVLDPVTVRDILGHADLKTTERYLHAVRASRLADVSTCAFTPENPLDRAAAARAALRAAAEQLGPGEARRILEGIG